MLDDSVCGIRSRSRYINLNGNFENMSQRIHFLPLQKVTFPMKSRYKLATFFSRLIPIEQ